MLSAVRLELPHRTGYTARSKLFIIESVLEFPKIKHEINVT